MTLNMLRISALCLSLTTLGLSACADAGPKETVGGIAGGVTGGLIGNQFGKGTGKFLATGAGALIGALIGSEIGKQLDEKDRAISAEAEYEALDHGQPGTAREWSNAASGHSGSVTPGPTYSVNDYNCRDYVHKVLINGRTETIRGTACKQPDGSWRPLS